MTATENIQAIREKIALGHRVSVDDARQLYECATDEDLRQLATAVKARHHKLDEATYLIMAIINYTNVCVAKCDYCAFYKLPHQSGTYLLSPEQIYERIDRVLDLGGTMVGFNGGFHPKLKIQDYAEIFQGVRSRYEGELQFYGMTVAEFMFSAKLTKMDYRAAARHLREGGSEWVTGGGAEILADSFRMRHSPGKYRVADYFLAQRALIEEGIGSTATMVIGFDETLDERMEHLNELRVFQDSVNCALPSFLCWTYKPYNTALGGQEISTQEYLRWLAICRIFLDNIPNIRTSVLTKNQDALLGLQFGANDFDLPTEDEVTQKAGATISIEFDRILNCAREMGFKTVHRAPFSAPQKKTSAAAFATTEVSDTL